MTVIIDTSFLVSLTNQKEHDHARCVEVARTMRQRMVVVPVTILPEATHIIAKQISHVAMRQFVAQMSNPLWEIENLTAEDLGRAHKILEKYRDAELDFADATIVALAERLNIKTVLTLDQRDFRMIRPKHTPYFTILPE